MANESNSDAPVGAEKITITVDPLPEMIERQVRATPCRYQIFLWFVNNGQSSEIFVS